MTVVRAGLTDWKIMISTGISINSGHDNAPAGDIGYIKSAIVDLAWRMGDKITRYFGRNSSSERAGRVAQDFRIIQGIILGIDLNDFTEYLIDKGHKYNANPLYAFLKLPNPSGDSSTFFKKFMNNEEEMVWHLRGYMVNPIIRITQGDVYKITMAFTECWK